MGDFLPPGVGLLKISKYKMKSPFQRSLPAISVVLLIALIASLFFYPSISSKIGIVLLIFGLGMALVFTYQKHIGSYKQGQITRLKFTRNILLDILGLLLTIAAASYLGSMAGTRLGASFGLAAGLIAGIGSAFVVAWGVRKLWLKVSAMLLA